MGVLEPPQEVEGLSDSLDYLYFTCYNIHHAPGILADQLVQVGMLGAATAVKHDQVRYVAADQEQVKSE